MYFVKDNVCCRSYILRVATKSMYCLKTKI